MFAAKYGACRRKDTCHEVNTSPQPKLPIFHKNNLPQLWHHHRCFGCSPTNLLGSKSWLQRRLEAGSPDATWAGNELRDDIAPSLPFAFCVVKKGVLKSDSHCDARCFSCSTPGMALHGSHRMREHTTLARGHDKRGFHIG